MITIEEIKKELKFDDNDNSVDTELSRYLEAGKSVIERIAGRKFFTTDFIEEKFYNFPIILRNTPVKDLEVKKIDTDGNTVNLVSGTEYQKRGGVIFIDREVIPNTNIIVLKYKIKENAFPELEGILSNYVKRYYKKNKFIGEKTTSNLEGGSTSWENYITQEEIKIIRSYFGGF